MKTLVVANQKGGVGKTSTLFHQALYLYEKQGKSVVVIDFDPQENTTYSIAKYGNSVDTGIRSIELFMTKDFSRRLPTENDPNKGPYYISADLELMDLESQNLEKNVRNLIASISRLGESIFDYALIDTSPSMGVKMTAALAASDYVLSPIELETFSLKGMDLMFRTITNIQNVNPALNFIGMVPNKVRNARHKNSLAEITEAYGQLVVPFHIGLRESISDAMHDGIPVWQDKRTAAKKAAKEMTAMCEYVYAKMEQPK